jgi:hypothetical protein
MAQKFLTEITLQALNNATTDTDKFLVSDSGTIKFRTGTEVLSDIGGAADANVVHKTGNESIAGVKTFTQGNTTFSNASNNTLAFTTGSASTAEFAINTTFTQFTSYGSFGYLFNGYSGGLMTNLLTLDQSGNGVFTANVRATSFTDKDNTSYYLNPAAFSNLYDITANTFVKSGGTSAQYLMADGSVSTGPSLAGYVPTSRTLTINGVTYDLSANRSWTVSVTETDTLQTVTSRGATTNLAITAPNYIFSGASTGAIGLVTSTSAFGTRSTDGTTYGYGVSTNISGGLDIMANQSGQPIRFWCGTTNVTPIQRMIISNGDVTATDSFRAPIFYDSNNTVYYVDPTATSNLVGLTVANTITGNISGNATYATNSTRLYASDGTYVYGGANPYYMSMNYNSSANRWRLSVTPATPTNVEVAYADSSGSAYGSNSLYITGYGSSNMTYYQGAGTFAGYSGWAGYLISNHGDGATYYNQTIITPFWGRPQYSRQQGNTTIYGPYTFWTSEDTITSSYNISAPVFQDYNNTGYYIDPASSSNIDSITTTRTRAIRSQSDGDYTTAALWTESYSTTTTGIAFHISGTVGKFLEMRTNGVLYWNGDILLNSSNYTSYAVPTTRTLTINGTTYDLSANRSWTVSAGAADFNTLTNKTGGTGTYQTSGDFRAPIFYDSNDTTYYLDPNNTTTAANLAGKVQINYGASSGTPIFQATGSYGTMSLNTYYGVFHTSGDFYIGNPAGGAANLTGAQANFNLFSDRNNSAYYADPSATSNFVGLTVANTISGNITGNAGTVSTITNRTNLMVNSLAAPALIDSLTTANFRSTLFGTTSNGYQISTARWNTTPSVLSGLTPYSTMIAWAGSDTQGFLAMDYSSPAARVGGGNGNNINWTRRVLLEDAWTNSKYFSSGGEIYAPVFYDANDSSFYFDGANTGDSIRVAGDIVAYYSDERLKDKKGNIENALEKVLSLNGFYYEPNETAQAFGYKKKLEVGVSAQEVEAVLPELIKDAPIGRGYKTLDYGKLTPLLIEAVKEQQKQIEELKELVNKLINK